MARKKKSTTPDKTIASLEKMSFYEFIQLLDEKETMDTNQDLKTFTAHAS